MINVTLRLHLLLNGCVFLLIKPAEHLSKLMFNRDLLKYKMFNVTYIFIKIYYLAYF